MSERLESLNLRRAQLHAEGLAALATALVDNRALKTLDLSQNRMQSSGESIQQRVIAPGGRSGQVDAESGRALVPMRPWADQ